MAHLDRDHPSPFDTLLGVAPGDVPVYSSHYASADPAVYSDRRSFRSYLDGQFMGYKWQCVEFARRWLYVNHGYVFEDVAMAYDIFELRTVRRVNDGMLLPLRSFANGSRRRPEPGCLLIWNEGGEFHHTGHVAIVSEVFDDRLRCVEQNVEHKVWLPDQQYSRELPVTLADDGGYFVHCNFDNSILLGWVVQTDDNQHAVTPATLDPALLALQARRAPHDAGADWIHTEAPIERAYLHAVGGAQLASTSFDQRGYFLLSETAEKLLRRASNELHAMFLYATDVVMQDEALLSHFNIPRAIWPKLQQSWNNRRNEMITGRFDFSLSERGLKVYEYNADSASCHLECGELQEQWAQATGADDGWHPGNGLHQHLVDAWRRAGIDGVLHIMLDQNHEETYHALYMQSALEKAGVPCKLITGLDSLGWDSDGYVVDADGLRVNTVWKTWAWETALEQIRQECDEEEAHAFLHAPTTAPAYKPRLIDVLLRKDVMVYEPLWTIIPSNKAILPILWKLFPNNPWLLNSYYEVNEDLAKRGYVVKPIAGRSGWNIRIYDSGHSMVDATDGKFSEQPQIFQRFFPLPVFDNHHIQVCSFTVAGVYAGSCLRGDVSAVITGHSDILPMRVVEDADLFTSN